MVKKTQVHDGALYLYDGIFLMQQNYSRASAQGCKLSWYYCDGMYWAVVKKNNVLYFRKPYKPDVLIRTILYMHIDFSDFLDLPWREREAQRETNINLPPD